MTKINLLLTYDYELPLGGCRDYNKGLFEPAQKLLELADKKKVKLILFTDICSAIMFEKWDKDNYYIPFLNQITEALSLSHDIELHIHPHWLTSIYKNGNYIPSNRKILSDFKNENYPDNIEGIIERSINKLNRICSMMVKNYKCIAYRGGGYNIFPETACIFKALRQNGIRFDSSIVKDYFFSSDIQNEDFRNMPKLANWYIGLDGAIGIPAADGLFEVPIASMPINILEQSNRIFEQTINKKYYNSIRYDNTGFGHTGNKSLWNKIKNYYYSPYILSFDEVNQDINVLEKIIRYQLEINKNDKEIYLCANSHPKIMGEYHLRLMSDFIDLMQQKYSNKIEFCTYHDIGL